MSRTLYNKRNSTQVNKKKQTNKKNHFIDFFLDKSLKNVELIYKQRKYNSTLNKKFNEEKIFIERN